MARTFKLLDPKTLRNRVLTELENTDLKPVGKLLLRLINGSVQADGTWENPLSQTTLHHARRILDRLPDATQERFIFDALMIQSLAQRWSGNSSLSNAIMPAYGEEWRFERYKLFPGPSEGQFYMLELIVVRGENNLDDANLLEYPWLVHELVHSLFYRNSAVVAEALKQRLTIPLRDLQSGLVSDRGQVRSIRQQQTEQIVKFWTPSEDHLNWAHELAIDVIGLATVGPAYGWNFLLETAKDTFRPFELVQSHPPFAIRCQALCLAAERLAWDELARWLTERMRRWTTSKEFGPIENMYRAAADSACIAAGLDATFDLIRTLQLPIFGRHDWDKAAENIRAGTQPALGAEMLAATWHAYNTFDESAFHHWMRETSLRAIE